MRYIQDGDRKVMERLRASLAMLGFGLALLALLIAIERPHWFVLRPVSGTAAALANASTPAPGESAAPRDTARIAQ